MLDQSLIMHEYCQWFWQYWILDFHVHKYWFKRNKCWFFEWVNFYKQNSCLFN